MVLKLDFREAFDSVSWHSLDRILQARSFHSKRQGWVSSILTTGKTVVLLNGVPENWVNCRNGLQQGDLLSPYLFIIVVDVLARLVRKEGLDGSITHPLLPNAPCPVLQYADDTLILLKGGLAAVRRLKQILDSFSAATGLTINYHKSTFIPMSLPEGIVADMSSCLGCSVSSFPMAYLFVPQNFMCRITNHCLPALIDTFHAVKPACWTQELACCYPTRFSAAYPCTGCLPCLSQKQLSEQWNIRFGPLFGLARTSATAPNAPWHGSRFCVLRMKANLESRTSKLKITACL